MEGDGKGKGMEGRRREWICRTNVKLLPTRLQQSDSANIVVSSQIIWSLLRYTRREVVRGHQIRGRGNVLLSDNRVARIIVNDFGCKNKCLSFVAKL